MWWKWVGLELMRLTGLDEWIRILGPYRRKPPYRRMKVLLDIAGYYYVSKRLNYVPHTAYPIIKIERR